MKIGDYVTRNKYKNDIVFIIYDITSEGLYKLKGEDVRLLADSFANDLSLYEKEERNIDEEQNSIIQVPANIVMGKVLHIDGDQRYLQKSLNLYKKYDIPVVAYYLNEEEIKNKITNLLIKHKPDILVITGHDAYKENSDTEEFKNSKNFVDAVKKARIYQPDKDALVIFAGACQSNYEALIESGANFASSPGRVSINVLDPVKIAIEVAKTNVRSFLDIEEILNKTTNKNQGIGGIDTRGVARKIY